ncbi:MAG: hypothetical protein LBE84_10385 [Planctomycetota bacterium]|jgi:predicted  nucleic acid-binding Zn-ribbon protein|nr:hypothetical protein [Planctomycetota bacterium]
MNGNDGKGGLWAGLIILGLATVVFAILWFQRGGEISRLRTETENALDSAAGTTRRFETDLRNAKADLDSATRRMADLEEQLKSRETRYRTDLAKSEERRRNEVETADARRREAATAANSLQSELDTTRQAIAEAAKKNQTELAAAGKELAGLREELEKEKRDAAALRHSEQNAQNALAAVRKELDAVVKTAAEREKTLQVESAELQKQLAGIMPGRERQTAGTGPADDENLSARVAELENALHAAETDRRTAIRDLTRELEAAKDEAKRYAEMAQAASRTVPGNRLAVEQEKELAKAREELRAALNDLGAARTSLTTVETEMRSLKAELTAKTADLDKTSAALAAKEKELAGAKADLAANLTIKTGDLAKVADALAAKEKELAGVKTSLTAKTGDLAKAADALAAKEKELAGVKAEQAAIRREYERNLARAGDEVRSEITRLRQSQTEKLAELDQHWLQRVEAAVRAGAEREKTLTAEWAKTRKGFEDRLADQEKRLNAALEQAKPATPPSGKGAEGRSISRIVERMPDGQTLLIPVGVESRVSQGMKFDVYRRENGGRRYIGGVKVIRVLDGCSLVVSTFSETEVATCPATGRAVLELGAAFSPFAAGPDGKALPLQTAAGVGLPLEAPAVGDLLDNPFYDPGRRLTFAIDPALAGDATVIRIIETLGGSPRTGAEAARADFLVAADDAQAATASGGPRRVLLAHLREYLDPELTAPRK